MSTSIPNIIDENLTASLASLSNGKAELDGPTQKRQALGTLGHNIVMLRTNQSKSGNAKENPKKPKKLQYYPKEIENCYNYFHEEPLPEILDDFLLTDFAFQNDTLELAAIDDVFYILPIENEFEISPIEDDSDAPFEFLSNINSLLVM